MRNIFIAGVTALILGGASLTGASAMPVAHDATITQASGASIVEARWHGRDHHGMRHHHRGHHYGWYRGRGNPHRFHHWR